MSYKIVAVFSIACCTLLSASRVVADPTFFGAEILPNAPEVSGGSSGITSLSPNNRWVVCIAGNLSALLLYDIEGQRTFSFKSPDDSLPFSGCLEAGWTPDSRCYFISPSGSSLNLENLPTDQGYVLDVGKTVNPRLVTFQQFFEELQSPEAKVHMSEQIRSLTCSDCVGAGSKETLPPDVLDLAVRYINSIDVTTSKDLSKLKRFDHLNDPFVVDEQSAKAWVGRFYFDEKGTACIDEYDFRRQTKQTIAVHRARPFTTARISFLSIVTNRPTLRYSVFYSGTQGQEWEERYLLPIGADVQSPIGPIIIEEAEGPVGRALYSSDGRFLYGINRQGKLIRVDFMAAEAKPPPAFVSEKRDGKFGILTVTPHKTAYRAGEEITIEIKPKTEIDLGFALLTVNGSMMGMVNPPSFQMSLTVPEYSVGPMEIKVLLMPRLSGDATPSSEDLELKAVLIIE